MFNLCPTPFSSLLRLLVSCQSPARYSPPPTPPKKKKRKNMVSANSILSSTMMLFRVSAWGLERETNRKLLDDLFGLHDDKLRIKKNRTIFFFFFFWWLLVVKPEGLCAVYCCLQFSTVNDGGSSTLDRLAFIFSLQLFKWIKSNAKRRS